MTATVNIRFGNLFDGPSDLIVLPCSTGGTVTGLVAQSLATYDIPFPPRDMKLGEVEIVAFEGAENIAQFVAFAASVSGNMSTLKAIAEIGRSLGEFTKRDKSVRAIAAPLLGAGAGGLQGEDVVEAFRTGFSKTAVDGAVLTISVLQRGLFDSLLHARPVRSENAGPQVRAGAPHRVFISHTSKSAIDIEWVKHLADFLIKQGIQARLDRLHLRRGMDLPQWMCNELAMASKVVVICDEAYKEKADGRSGGVGWETMIIQGDIAKLPPDSTKYQVVVRCEDMDQGTPLYLKTKFAFHVPPSADMDAFRADLVRELLDLPLDHQVEIREFSL